MKGTLAKPKKFITRKDSSNTALCPCTECLSTDLEQSGLHIRCRKCGYSCDYDHSDFERSMIYASGQKESSERSRINKLVNDWNQDF